MGNAKIKIAHVAGKLLFSPVTQGKQDVGKLLDGYPIPELPKVPTIVFGPNTHQGATKRTTEEGKKEWPTTQETIHVVKGDIVSQIDQLLMDMARGGLIAQKPCDCQAKHSKVIKALANELMTLEYKPVYGELIAWVDDHMPQFTADALIKNGVEYYQQLMPEMRVFRKRIEGTMA